MDSAVWVFQSVVDQRRSELEAEAAAHRLALVARRTRRFRPVPAVPAAPAVAMGAAPEPVADDLELVAAGDSR